MLLEELAREQVTQDLGWHCGGRIQGIEGGVGEKKGRWEMEESGEEWVVK